MTADGSGDPRAWQGWDPPAGLPDRAGFRLLVEDAAGRAAAILAGADDPVYGPSFDGAVLDADRLLDAVRLLASDGGTTHLPAAAARTGRSEDELRRLVLSYRHGGPAAVAAAVSPSPAGAADDVAAAASVRRRRTLAVGDLAVEPGAVTDPGAGVRVCRGPDGYWYPFTLARGQWWPAAGAGQDAGTAYQAAVRARTRRRPGG